MLLRTFGPERGMRKLHNKDNEQLHTLYSSPNILRVIKLRKMKWVGHITHMTNSNKILLENLKETDHFVDLGKDGRITFKCNREEGVAYLVQSNGCTLSAV